MTVSCPLDCEYLQEARKHDRPAPLDPEQIPERDIEISEEFLAEHEELFPCLAGAVARSALGTPGVVDSDVREALDGLIRTYRTLQSGVYYESRPDNPLARSVFAAAQQALAQFRAEEQRTHGMARTRDADILRMLVFLRRVETDRNNGRPRGRAFVDALRAAYAEGAASEPRESPSSLLLP